MAEMTSLCGDEEDVPLVYGLKNQHEAGTVCGVPCAVCGGDMVRMSGPGCHHQVKPIPLFIVREATYEEYVASVKANGGGQFLAKPGERFFYVVTTD